MGLDKWLKPEKDKEEPKKKIKISKKESIKKKSQPAASSKKKEPEKTSGARLKKITKFILTCPKKSCNYQKTIMKSNSQKRIRLAPDARGK